LLFKNPDDVLQGLVFRTSQERKKIMKKSIKTSAMHSGGVSLLRGFIYLIIALISFYGDGVFVWMNIGHYTGSYAVIFQIFLVLGAFCTSASIMALLFGKAAWFTPGKQLWIAYIFTAVEVIVNVLNIVIALNPNLGIVELWRIFSPATPFVALIGWIFILQVDKSQREHHKLMEMEEQKNDAEREYEMMVHQANMDLKFGYLDQTKQRLQAALNSPMAQAIVEQHAQNLTAQVLNEITGLPVMQQQPPPSKQTVQFNQDVQSAIFKSDPDTRVDYPLASPQMMTGDQMGQNGRSH